MTPDYLADNGLWNNSNTEEYRLYQNKDLASIFVYSHDLDPLFGCLPFVDLATEPHAEYRAFAGAPNPESGVDYFTNFHNNLLAEGTAFTIIPGPLAYSMTRTVSKVINLSPKAQYGAYNLAETLQSQDSTDQQYPATNLGVNQRIWTSPMN